MDLLSKRIVEQVREKAQARSAEQIAKGVMSKDTKQAISESTATMNRMREAMQDVVAKTISERTPDNIPSRISEPVIEGAPEKPEMGSREPYELEVDTIGNEALDSSGKTEMSKDEADYETGKKLREEALKGKGIMAPADGGADGVQPTDGKVSEDALQESIDIISNSVGIDADTWNVYRQEIANIESKGSGDYLAKGGYNDHYDGRYQLGRDAKIDAGKLLGIDLKHDADSREAFRNDPSLQERAFAAYTAKNHSYMMKNSTYKNMTPKEQAVVLAYAHNQGHSKAKKWLNTGKVGADAFGTKGTKYSDALRTALGI
jgi:hypothetical protein